MRDVRRLSSDIVFAYASRETIWPGIGMSLLEGDATITHVLFRAESIINLRLGWSLLEVLQSKGPPQEFMLEPMNTATQLALTAAWHDRGIKPTAVLGRCGGEFAAVHASGAISFDDALDLACRVSGLVRAGRGQGKMVRVMLPESEVKGLSEDCPAPFAVITEGAGGSTIIGCDAGDLEAVEAFLAKHQVQYGVNRSRFAPHTWIVESWREEMLRPLHQPGRCSIPIYSGTAQGRLASEVDLATHFWRIVREPLSTRSAIRSALDDGLRCLVEVGGHPTLQELILGEARARSLHVAAFATMEHLRSLR